MQVFRGFRHPGVAPACALTIGNFDGVHRGHQAMLALLQTEARQLAQGHVLALTAAMADANRLALEIAEGGDAYPPGIRDLARRFAEDCDIRVQSIEAINARA